MPFTRRAAMGLGLAALVAACGRRAPSPAIPDLYPNESPRIRRLINAYADGYKVPRDLVHRVVQRESSYNPGARNGPYYGLMQILPATARTMGHRGPASELLDPSVNLRYGVKYLRGAWIVANGNRDKAVQWYARGYYYEARDRCLLVETGLRDSEVKC
ncbi:lytic transglycosylase domain-containing protein [Limimaricola pyoseonensis]|uniref:Transglycosylase SLT domain-containing protein n=1 Tax=Limimaricola pyoseonensis TaxID=521013 RepID=A0A1G7APT4_9RHOB|nr:lytic transglycosylase domain-containing protein [Limimaricola pyoseonensis]SDE16487.1 Transglycosylase SLT domain-containing protein [Limimaricola pyoseonensis]